MTTRIGELTRVQQLGVVGAALAAQARAAPHLFRRTKSSRPKTSPPTPGISAYHPPDSKLCQNALNEAENYLTPEVLTHSLRCWRFGVALAELDGYPFDPETLYVACLLHDIALGAADDPHVGCFATLGAARARAFVLENSATPTDNAILGNDGTPDISDRVHDAIARHMDVSTPTHIGPEAALLHDAAHLDVVGTRAHQLDADLVAQVHADLPRTGFALEFASAMRVEARLRPRSTAATLWRAGMPLALRLNPLDRRPT